MEKEKAEAASKRGMGQHHAITFQGQQQKKTEYSSFQRQGSFPNPNSTLQNREYRVNRNLKGFIKAPNMENDEPSIFFIVFFL